MASKTEETPPKEEMLEKEGPETLPDRPLLDLSDAAVKKLIRSAKKRGYVTHDQINAVLQAKRPNDFSSAFRLKRTKRHRTSIKRPPTKQKIGLSRR
jgi:Sigma-70 factor, region 1.1